MFFDIARDCYEAYVIYTFFKLIAYYLGGEEALISLMSNKQKHAYAMPCCCLHYQPDISFYWECMRGIVQYVILRPLMAIIAAITYYFGVYKEGAWEVDNAYAYTAFINNISVCFALYYLVLFYECMADELKPHKPLMKFLAIKGVIFFTFWQGIGIYILIYLGMIPETPDHDKEDISNKLQDSLVCLEMFFAAVVHKYCFTHEVYVQAATNDVSLVSGGVIDSVKKFSTIMYPGQRNAAKLRDVASPTDVVTDAKKAFQDAKQETLRNKYSAFVDDGGDGASEDTGA
jgi:hypothetical protein